MDIWENLGLRGRAFVNTLASLGNTLEDGPSPKALPRLAKASTKALPLMPGFSKMSTKALPQAFRRLIVRSGCFHRLAFDLEGEARLSTNVRRRSLGKCEWAMAPAQVTQYKQNPGLAPPTSRGLLLWDRPWNNKQHCHVFRCS